MSGGVTSQGNTEEQEDSNGNPLFRYAFYTKGVGLGPIKKDRYVVNDLNHKNPDLLSCFPV